ncbi:MAG: nitrilase-related carbon-nitrogen hydrolase [Singulisphaera sp.]
MRRPASLLVLMIGIVGTTTVDESRAGPPGGRPSKADQPPRKVVVGTAIFGPYGEYPGRDERLAVLGGLIDEMARQSAAKYPGHGLDLAILPETTVTSTTGPASARATRLDGPVRATFGAAAREHKTYLIASMDLAEGGAARTTYANAAVLFDRKGEVAGIYRKAHPVAMVGSDEPRGPRPRPGFPRL